MNESRHLIIITGPTAVGKTDLSIELAQYLDTEIISADSRQIYKEMKIGVARPSEEQLASVSHHFVASHSIHELFTVADYEIAAESKLKELFETKRYVVCTGGTGLYLKALIQGLDQIPKVDPLIGRNFQNLLENEGLESIQKILYERDFDYYNQVDLNNSRRLIRALEVLEGTGKKFSKWRTEQKKVLPYKVHYFVLDRPREELYNRINYRVDLMMQAGLLEEAKKLFTLKDLRSLQTVGYSELFQVFEGEMSLENAVLKIKQHSRNYAKRQLTWFRGVEEAQWKLADNLTVEEIFTSIKKL